MHNQMYQRHQVNPPVPDREATNMCYEGMSVEELWGPDDEVLELLQNKSERRNIDDR